MNRIYLAGSRVCCNRAAVVAVIRHHVSAALRVYSLPMAADRKVIKRWEKVYVQRREGEGGRRNDLMLGCKYTLLYTWNLLFLESEISGSFLAFDRIFLTSISRFLVYVLYNRTD